MPANRASGNRAPSSRAPARQGWLGRHRKAFDDAVRDLRRRPWSTLATVCVVAVALALPALAWLARDLAGAVGGQMRAEPEVSVLLEPQLESEDAEEVAAAYFGAHAPAFVTGWRLLDRDEVLEEFRDAAGVALERTDLGEDNPLPLILVVTLDAAVADPAATGQWAEGLRGDDRVAQVLADTGWLARLRSVGALAGRGLLVLGLGLVGSVLLVVGQALRALLEQRAAAVEVAKLCGATDAFVRRPFIYGGLLLGGAGGLLSAVLLVGGTLAVAGPLSVLMDEFVSEYSLTWRLLPVLAVLPVVGAVLGLAGALLTVNGRIRQIMPR